MSISSSASIFIKIALSQPKKEPSLDLKSETDKESFVQSPSGDTVLVQVYVKNCSSSVTEKQMDCFTGENKSSCKTPSRSPLYETSPILYVQSAF